MAERAHPHEGRFVGVRCDGRTAIPSGEAPERPAATVYERLHGWLMTQRTETGFRFAEGREQTLISTSCGILLLESLDHLGDFSTDQKDLWRQDLQRCQDEATGLFCDPVLDRFPLDSN